MFVATCNKYNKEEEDNSGWSKCAFSAQWDCWLGTPVVDNEQLMSVFVFSRAGSGHGWSEAGYSSSHLCAAQTSLDLCGKIDCSLSVVLNHNVTLMASTPPSRSSDLDIIIELKVNVRSIKPEFLQRIEKQEMRSFIPA